MLIGTTNTSRLLAGPIPPGGSREPAGEGGDEVAELVRSLDDERPVERREPRGQPLEPLRMQLDAEPAFGLRACAAHRRQPLHRPDRGVDPSPAMRSAGRTAAG